MKRLVNIRLAVISAFGIGVGTALGFACFYYSLSYLWLIITVPVTAAFLIIFIVKGSRKYIALTAVTAALFIAGFSGVTYKLDDFSNKQLTGSASYLITGTVTEKGYTDDGEYIKLKNVTADGVKADGRMYVYLDYNYGDYCDIGYTVSFTGTVYESAAYAYGTVSSTRLIENIRYTVYLEDELTSQYNFTVFGSINIQIRKMLFDCMDSDVAAVAYGMLTGNTEYVEDGTIEYFQYGGVAHVFAVSGLHIGLVFAAITFILKKLRVNRYVSAILSVGCIFFYAGICCFTISSVRAAIMCTVMLAVKLSGGKYDSLSALAIAFIVLLLINPLHILSVGFQLSIAAVAGIALLSPVISRTMAKIKIPDKVSSVVSIALSAQLATFPILLSSFGYVSWASLLMNIIFVPVLSAEFTLLFVCMLLALIVFPLAEFLLLIPSAPLAALMSLLVSIKAEQVLISGFEFGWLVLLYYAVILILTDKVNFSRRMRIAFFTLGAAVLSFAMFIINYVPSGRLTVTGSAWYGDSSAVLFRTDGANVLVICETPSAYDIGNLMRTNGVSEPDAIIILGGDESIYSYTLCGTKCTDIYLYYMNLPVQPYHGVTVHYLETFTIGGVTYTFTDYGNLLAEYDGITIGINMYEDVAFSSCDLLFAENYTSSCSTVRTIYFRQVSGYDNIYEQGDLQFTVNNGKLYG